MTFKVGDPVVHRRTRLRGTVLPRNAAGGMFVGAHETVIRCYSDERPLIVATRDLEPLDQQEAV